MQGTICVMRILALQCENL